MFLDFYKMKEQPFGVTPDPRFLYLGQSHREALASLYYGIESNRGFVALIAEPGLGKTTLTFQLLEKLQQDSRTVFLFQTQCNSKEFFQYLLNGLGVDADGMELVSMHNKLNQILSREMLAGRRFILAVDEAQNLDPQVLETVRLLSNFETSRHKMLQIILVGQPQLARKLATPELEQLQQRISVFAKIEPLGPEDTARYIAHRLQVAGYQGSPLFSAGALQLIAQQSKGIPRKINSLCFGSLSLACAMGRIQVDVALVEEVIADRNVESLQKSGVVPSVAPPAASHPAFAPPVTPRPALSSYPEIRKRSLGPWAMGAACIAAFVAIGIGTLSLSPRKVDWAIQESSVAWTSTRSFLAVKPHSGPISSTLNVQAAELSNAESSQPSSSDHDAQVNSVVVQSGETLRQVLLRTVGEYDKDVVEQIHKLNSDITDFDHLEAGQTIRLPRASVPGDSVAAATATTAGGKN